jgi:serine/threonine protein kinase
MIAGLDRSQQIDMTMYMVAHDHGLRLDGPISSQHSHVFKAVDEHGNKHVLKSARSTGSLAREVEVIEKLAEIPGVFLPHTITRYKGRIFFIFDFVKTLDEVIDQGTRLPLLYKLIYMQHATQTVAHIHEAGYVHKDLTTKNLYPDDTMLVGDLGDAGVEGELVTGVEDEIRTSIGYFSPTRTPRCSCTPVTPTCFSCAWCSFSGSR